MHDDDPSNSAKRDTTMARDVSNHRPVDIKDEPFREGETLLRAEPRGDNLSERRPSASNRHTDRDCNRRHDNNESSTSMASSVDTASTEDNTACVVQVNGKIQRVRTLQTIIEIRILPRYADSEARPNDARAFYTECVVRVVEDGFKKAPQLKQN